jgi:Type I phosphodiesterase / nucleotide pyrophosphatase
VRIGVRLLAMLAMMTAMAGCGNEAVRHDPSCQDRDDDGFFAPAGCGTIEDCDDGDASINWDGQEGPYGHPSCSDGLDNDCDGLTDAEDPPCERGDFNVIIVGWDGVQRDHFNECLNREIPECSNGLPHVTELSNGVFWNNTTTSGFTATKPGWAQIISGYDAEVMGIISNKEFRPLPEGYSIFEKVEAFHGEENLVTIFLAGKFGNTGGGCSPLDEEQSQPYCKTKQHLDYFENGLFTEAMVGEKALALIEQYKDERLLALIHFAQPDDIGHVCGENCPVYSSSIVGLDAWLGRIVDRLRDLGIYEKTFLYVTSDHGFDEGKWNHRNAPYTIMATNDRSVMRSGDRKDIAPTILERFGIPRKADGALPPVDGYSLYSVPPLPCISEGEAFLDYPGAPECCEGLRKIGLDKPEPNFQICVAPTGGSNEDSGRCTRCGDGTCTPPENKCNCPEDCEVPGLSSFSALPVPPPSALR